MKILPKSLKLVYALILIYSTSFALYGCEHKPIAKFSKISCAADLQALGRKIECATIEVNQEISASQNANLRRILIPIVIIRAKTPAQLPPVFYLHGGPGGGVLSDLAETLNSPIGAELIGQDQDWVFFDQRGTGQSLPRLDCGKLALNDAGPQSTAVVAELGKCANALKAQGIDFSNFNLATDINDIVQIADALDMPKIDILGHSYGSRVALEMLRKFPQRVNAAALDSPWTPEASWSEPGPKWVSDALKQVLTLCQQDQVCNNKYPNLSEKTNLLMANLLQQNANWQGQEYSANQFAQFLMDQLYDGEMLRDLPRNLHVITNGDFAPLKQYLIGAGADYDEAQHMAFLCHDELAFENPQTTLALSKGDPIAAAVAKTMVNYFAACDAFDAKKAPAEINHGIKSNIPTFFVAAGIDPGCPASLSQSAITDFSNGQLAILPVNTHGPVHNNECARKMIREFFLSPQKRINMQCIGANGTNRIVWN